MADQEGPTPKVCSCCRPAIASCPRTSGWQWLIGRALVYAAEVAAVRHTRLWPRALDLTRPTKADARALAREQERIPAARMEFHLAAPGSPPVQGGSPPASDGPG